VQTANRCTVKLSTPAVSSTLCTISHTLRENRRTTKEPTKKKMLVSISMQITVISIRLWCCVLEVLTSTFGLFMKVRLAGRGCGFPVYLDGSVQQKILAMYIDVLFGN
jgi:hypothetical protein